MRHTATTTDNFDFDWPLLLVNDVDKAITIGHSSSSAVWLSSCAVTVWVDAIKLAER